MCERCAIFECFFTYKASVFTHVNLCKFCAATECACSNEIYKGFHLLQSGAVLEGIITHFYHVTINSHGHLGQVGGPFKGIVVNTCHIVGSAVVSYRFGDGDGCSRTVAVARCRSVLISNFYCVRFRYTVTNIVSLKIIPQSHLRQKGSDNSKNNSSHNCYVFYLLSIFGVTPCRVKIN